MRNTRYGFLVLLSSLLILTGCSRRDILDDYPVSGVDIKLDWDGVTDQLPEGVRVIFYPKSAEGRKIVGDADIFLFPDIHAGNITYKCLVHTCKGVKNGNILTGTKAPVILTSRSDTFEVKVNSIALAAVVAETMKNTQ